MIIIRFTLLTTILFLAVCISVSCDSGDIAPENSDCNSRQIYYDATKLKPGAVSNLDVYSGIRFFKFEMSYDSLRSCVNCWSDSIYKFCDYKERITFLDQYWTVGLFFISDQLSTVILSSDYPNDQIPVNTLYNNLISLFSQPLEGTLQVTSKNLHSDIYTFRPYLKENSQPYREDLQKLIASLTKTKEKETIYTGSEPVSIMGPTGKSELPPPREINLIKTRISFYTSLTFQSTWQANSLLQLKLKRVRNLEFSKSANLYEAGDYKFNDSWHYKLFYSKNKLSYSSLNALLLKKEKDEQRSRIIQQEKKAANEKVDLHQF